MIPAASNKMTKVPSWSSSKPSGLSGILVRQLFLRKPKITQRRASPIPKRISGGYIVWLKRLTPCAPCCANESAMPIHSTLITIHSLNNIRLTVPK